MISLNQEREASRRVEMFFRQEWHDYVSLEDRIREMGVQARRARALTKDLSLAEQLSVLDDEAASVRMGLAENPHLDEAVIPFLLDDECADVQFSLAKRTDLDSSLLLRLRDHHDAGVRRQATRTLQETAGADELAEYRKHHSAHLSVPDYVGDCRATGEPARCQWCDARGVTGHLACATHDDTCVWKTAWDEMSHEHGEVVS